MLVDTQSICSLNLTIALLLTIGDDEFELWSTLDLSALWFDVFLINPLSDSFFFTSSFSSILNFWPAHEEILTLFYYQSQSWIREMEACIRRMNHFCLFFLIFAEILHGLKFRRIRELNFLTDYGWFGARRVRNMVRMKVRLRTVTNSLDQYSHRMLKSLLISLGFDNRVTLEVARTQHK